jgi:hypothetical protein
MRSQLVALIAGAALFVQPAHAGAQRGWLEESWTFNATGTPIGPRVGMDAIGSATAVWLHCSAGSLCGVVVARRFGTGTWTAPTAVTPMGDYGPPLLVVDPVGNATVVWTTGGYLLQAVRYSVSHVPASQDLLPRSRSSRPCAAPPASSHWSRRPATATPRSGSTACDNPCAMTSHPSTRTVVRRMGPPDAGDESEIRA